ncbi:Cu(I)-responsive transcriptional regulator [Arenimonas maotaiensis]|uniref:Cu(I)-responsive transcriptional regulator n=2 Tax=Arenimonas maotaiensis TaxID=1446479 RepID=A0A917FPR2_9GAMM|nr:Cu(I)-responsive transcriptional regulator [Arenimonas maotaiensis]
MIRHYERIGLLPEAGRSVAGYRLYGTQDIATLRFIRQSRELGFSLSRIGSLLGLRDNRGRKSCDVRRLAEEHLADIGRKLAELQAMQDALRTLVQACHGDDAPDCAILDGLQNPDALPRRS